MTMKSKISTCPNCLISAAPVIILLWFYELWTIKAQTKIPRHTLHNQELKFEIREVSIIGGWPGDGYHLPSHLRAAPTGCTNTMRGTRSSIPSQMPALISSSALLPVTPAITTPTTYFRKHRIFEYLSQTRCLGSGVETRFGSQLNFIRPVGLASKNLQNRVNICTLYRDVRGQQKGCLFLSNKYFPAWFFFICSCF